VRPHTKLDPTRTGDEARKLEGALRKRVVGQDEAIDAIVGIYQMFLAGLSDPCRPIGNFLFLGPTGIGKTRIVEATAECLAGDARAMIKVDCAEFQHSHEIAKLIGSPPGYLGHRETHPALSQEILNRYSLKPEGPSVVLFDEIEKASDALWNLLLGILDKATLTLGDNRRVDFSRTLIFMTSNLGAREMDSIQRPGVGFAASVLETLHRTSGAPHGGAARIVRAGREAARKRFHPEFMNRLDKIVVFRSLGEAELRKILGLELNRLRRHILHSSPAAPFAFALTEAAKNHLLREGTDERYGARHLKRVIDNALVQPLSKLIATRQVREGDWIKIDYDVSASQMTFTKEAENLSAYAMAQLPEGPACVPSITLEMPSLAAPTLAGRDDGKGSQAKGRNAVV